MKIVMLNLFQHLASLFVTPNCRSFGTGDVNFNRDLQLQVEIFNQVLEFFGIIMSRNL